MKSRRFIATLCLLLLPFFFINATVLKSSTTIISDSLFSLLENENLEPQKQFLQGSLSDTFPYNILINYKSSKTTKHLILLFSQEDGVRYLEEIVDLAHFYKKKNYPLNIQIVLTANDTHSFTLDTNLPKDYKRRLDGCQTFASSIQKKDRTLILIAEHDEKTRSFFPGVPLIPGGINKTASLKKGVVVPRTALKALLETFHACNEKFHLENNFLSLYRLGLLEGTKRESLFLENNISTITLLLKNDTTTPVFSVMKKLPSSIHTWVTSEKDVHYAFFEIGARTFWITEQAFIILLIVASIITLFIFTGLSFIHGAHSHIHRKEFLQTWPLIPFTFILTALFLELGQRVSLFIIPNANNFPLLILLLKTIFCFLFLLIISFIQHFFSLPITGFIYGYLLAVTSFINIFIFATIDLPLTILFLIEYLIVYSTRKTRKIIPLIAVFLAMLLPYAIFMSSLLFYKKESLLVLVDSPFFINVLYGCILVPFEIIIIRILVRMHRWGQHPSIKRKHILLRVSIATIISLILSFIPYFALREKNLQETPFSNPLHNDENNYIEISASKKDFFDRSFAQLSLSSKLPVLRYDISIKSKNPLPILEANFPYDMLESPGFIRFDLSENPPEPLTLTFTYNSKWDDTVFIKAYLIYGGEVFSIEKEYTFKGSEK